MKIKNLFLLPCLLLLQNCQTYCSGPNNDTDEMRFEDMYTSDNDMQITDVSDDDNTEITDNIEIAVRPRTKSDDIPYKLQNPNNAELEKPQRVSASGRPSVSIGKMLTSSSLATLKIQNGTYQAPQNNNYTDNAKK